MKAAISINSYLSIVLFLFSSFTVIAQKNTYPLPKDVVTLSGIIEAAYDAISGEEGSPRQVNRIKSLYIPNGIISKNSVIDGSYSREVLTIDEFQKRFPAIRKSSFYEEEINREVRIFGTIASVWSSYQIRNAKNGPIVHRGINNIQLHFKDSRWWIVSWSWDAETEKNKIPASFDIY